VAKKNVLIYDPKKERKKDFLFKQGVKEIVFIEDKYRELTISLEDFVKHSRTWSHGHGKQLTISESYLKEGCLDG
jgi:hypothetical protein